MNTQGSHFHGTFRTAFATSHAKLPKYKMAGSAAINAIIRNSHVFERDNVFMSSNAL
jgi:hypothetical protein